MKSWNRSWLLGLLGGLLSDLLIAAGNVSGQGAEGDTALSSEKPHIPGPMFFDLVRPLGVRQGELEINTLAAHNLLSGETEWAPEIEGGIADNLALELEWPFHNLSLRQYKVALQGTLGALGGHRFIHGWQGIGYYDRHHRRYTADVLYLAGFRLDEHVSSLHMGGLRREGFDAKGEFAGLFNTSWFYDTSQSLTFGIEMNNEFRGRKGWHYLLLPQIHMDFAEHTTLQWGVGVSQQRGQHTEWVAAWRMIYAF